MLRTDSGFLVLDTKITSKTKKKMSGHSYVALAGLDKYNKRGDTLLQLLGYYKPDFDPKYQYRGLFAEKMVKFILDRQGRKYITYDDNYLKTHNYDCFPQYQYCGGIPDIEIPSESLTIEIKSKPLKRYNEIMAKMPQEEVEQGLYYAYLRNHNNLIMAYVFFDEITEKELFENKIPTTLDNCKVVFKKVPFNPDDVKMKISNALSFYNICLDNTAIPLEDISPEVMQILKEKGLFDN